MNQGLSLRLEFGDEVPLRIRGRALYAFRVFAAIYGHEVVDGEGEGRTARFFYGASAGAKAPVRRIPARYVPRKPEDGSFAPTPTAYGQEEIYLFHGRDPVSGNPDWLGEIFEWLSGADERSVSERDSIGRISYEQSVFARHAISPLRPHASLIMAWLQSFVSGHAGPEHLARAPSPLPDVKHLVISSHDIDFYFTGRGGSLFRIVKNLGIAAVVARSYPFFKDSMRQLFRLAGGERVGDFLPALLNRSVEDGFTSTCFVLARREHRRDANYTLKQIAYRLREIGKAGSSLALHGSYCSIVENSDLTSEAAVLHAEMGEWPHGSRQHWLRFDDPEKLFANIEKAGLQYDSSWGWAGQPGFRHGAAFAFPPYNFAREEAYNFLVIPLVIMDQGLQNARRESPERPAQLATSVLDQSRRWGWGGVSVLWHNPVEPLSACDDVNQVFWQQVRGQAQHLERWMSAEEFMNISLPRFQRAGLMKSPGACLKAELLERTEHARRSQQGGTVE
jgi:hypothetical protein